MALRTTLIGMSSLRRDATICIVARGAYFLCNDRALGWAQAFLNSFRRFNPTLPLTLIPFDDRVDRVVELGQKYQFGVLGKEWLTSWDQLGANLTERYAQRQMFRKLACFQGPYDHWLYFDADCVILDDLTALFDAMEDLGRTALYFYDDDGCLDFVYPEPSLAERMVRDYQAVGFNAGLFGASLARGVLENVAAARSFLEAERAGTWSAGQDQVFLNVLIDVSSVQKVPLRALLRENVEAGIATNSISWIDCHLDKAKRSVAPAAYCPFLHWAGFKSPFDSPVSMLWVEARYPRIPTSLIPAWNQTLRMSAVLRRVKERAQRGWSRVRRAMLQ